MPKLPTEKAYIEEQQVRIGQIAKSMNSVQNSSRF